MTRGLVAVTLVALSLIISFANVQKDCPLFTKYEVTDSDARCLDGSRGSYHVLPAKNLSSTKYFVHFQGGGWCYDFDSCLKRSLTSFGSSKSIGRCDTPVLPGIYKYFAKTHHVVQINYCDGGSFSGNASASADVSSQSIDKC
jgi:hypothetical protein